MFPSPSEPIPPPASSARPTHVRHIVLGLTVLVYMLTYMDRNVLSAATPSIRKEFGFTIVTMGWIGGSFRWAYSIFQLPSAWLGDRFGARKALAAIVLWWSVFTCGTTFAWSAASMVAIRFLFGAGEAGAFPIATRSLSRWILPSERGFAQGITHAGSRFGSALSPAVVGLIIVSYGWRSAFLIFGALGVVWSVVWFCYYRDTPAEHPRANAAEREMIAAAIPQRSAVGHSVPWRAILTSPQMWLLAVTYFCYAYTLAIYLDWFPQYLNAERGFSIQKMGFFASLPLCAAVIGDLTGGWLSDIWARHIDLRSARKRVAVGGYLLGGVSILAACLIPDAYWEIFFTCFAMFGLELTVGVSWAVPLDIGGDYAGTVSAVMNSFGNMGGAIATTLSAYLVTYFGWTSTFIVMSALSFVAALLFTRIDASKRIA